MSDKKVNVLIVHNYYQIPGGEDTVVYNEKEMLEQNGHIVTLYTRSNSEIKDMPKWKKLAFPILMFFNPKTFIEIRRIIKCKRIDVVHVHNTFGFISASVYYAAMTLNIPVVQTIHNFRLLCPSATFYRENHICEDCVKYGLKCAVEHNCYHNSKLQTVACVVGTYVNRVTGIYGKINYICLTEFNKKKLLELKQVKENQIFVKPNFVSSVGAIIPEKNRKEQFIFAGRLDKLKGIDLLFEAWKMMGSSAPKLIVCGIGELKEWCEEFIKSNCVNIEMRGYIPNEEVKKIIAMSKGLVLPTQWYEGFPMSIVESFSVGTPVVCSNIGNVNCIVENGITGYKFQYNSVKDLVECITKCSGLCEKTYKTYCEKYTEQINYEILNGIYEKVV